MISFPSMALAGCRPAATTVRPTSAAVPAREDRQTRASVRAVCWKLPRIRSRSGGRAGSAASLTGVLADQGQGPRGVEVTGIGVGQTAGEARHPAAVLRQPGGEGPALGVAHRGQGPLVG